MVILGVLYMVAGVYAFTSLQRSALNAMTPAPSRRGWRPTIPPATAHVAHGPRPDVRVIIE